MNKKLLSLTAIVFLIALFFGINIIAQNVFKGASLDLTADRLFTLSDGARSIARGIDEQITLRYYFSSKAAVDNPDVMAHAQRVRELLEEFAKESKGKIALKIVNPEPYSDDEEQAVRDGLEPIPVSAKGDVMFFGLVGTNTTTGKQVIPQFDPRGERLLEYDLAKMLHALKTSVKKKIGVMSTVGIQTFGFDPATQRPVPKTKWRVFVDLAESFEVEELQPTVTEIPPYLEVLAVVHPKNLSDQTLYAIDQFVMRGGRLMVFVDPQCQTDDSINARDQMQAMMADRSSNLKKLLDVWGVEVSDTQVVLDNTYAPRRQVQQGQGVIEVPTLPFLMLKGAAIVRDDEVGRGLESVNAYFTGSIKAKADVKSGLTIQPLLESSEDSMLIEKSQLQFVQDMSKVMEMFNSQNTKHTIAARLSGRIQSAFPGGPPAPAPADPSSPPPPAPDASKHLKESKGIANIILTADVDMLNDQAWGQEYQVGRQRMFMAAASNGLYFVGGLENLSGSSELLSIKPRASGARPFDRVEKIKAEAAKEVAAAQKASAEKVRQFEMKLSEEIRKRQPKADGTFDAPPDLEERIKKLQADLYQANKENRQVLRDQNKGIEAMGRNLRAINVALVPALVALLAVGVGVYRANRRSTVRRAAQN
ncbi:MAG: GldG family protein [Tepidisphaera sp.]|jgi:ABC-type uncharacterized transport system involved in gliding motility auxiliary subunit